MALVCVAVSEDAPLQAGCRRTPAGQEYNGTMNRTAEGLVCQQWGLDTPHSHSYNNLSGRVSRRAGAHLGSGFGPQDCWTHP